MKKKLLSLLLLAALLLSLGACKAIENLSILQEKQDNMNYIEVDGEIHITGYTDKTTVTELRIPDTIENKPVTVIEDFGVSNADSLTKITLGKNVREIGTWSMTNNQHLAAFEVAEGNETFKAVDGVLFSADGKTLYYYPCGRGITFDRFGMAQKDADGNDIYVTYEIPDGVERVNDKAFYKCYYVDIVSFPDTIRVIGEKAFHRCSSLHNFTMPAAIETIGKDAFSYNENLTELTIGENIREIGDYAFFYCKNLKNITIHAAEESLTLGDKWQPMDKGKVLKDLTVTFQDG